jgi:hypothetical protein
MTSRNEIYLLLNAAEYDYDRTKHNKPTVKSEMNNFTVGGFLLNRMFAFLRENARG